MPAASSRKVQIRAARKAFQGFFFNKVIWFQGSTPTGGDGDLAPLVPSRTGGREES
jgi:hypothetical protein